MIGMVCLGSYGLWLVTEGEATMLFWEALGSRRCRKANRVNTVDPFVLRSARLPYDKRCVAMTRSGRRCRGRIREGSEFCSFHDPEVSQRQRQHNAANGGRRRAFLSHIPDGYLRKLIRNQILHYGSKKSSPNRKFPLPMTVSPPVSPASRPPNCLPISQERRT